jgi:hypothetical protein
LNKNTAPRQWINDTIDGRARWGCSCGRNASASSRSIATLEAAAHRRAAHDVFTLDTIPMPADVLRRMGH